MKHSIRAGIVVGLALALAGISAGSASASEGNPKEQDRLAVAVEPCREIFEPGAASMEPAQEIEEEIHDAAQLAWIESIWISP